MASVELTETDFEDIATQSDIVIVDFWASWCGPCRSFAPVYEQTSEKYPDVVLAKVNTEEQQARAVHFQISSIPTLMLFREKNHLKCSASSAVGDRPRGNNRQGQGRRHAGSPRRN